ncbi:MAG: MMPL family transporter [Gilliamella sp.]|uniref:MMPL family transporter n=1 Tax=Gilliamella sp. TaxID=1891236 RepID=UPI00260A31BD|nr:MMPL family transporter [Gilliamella sp.]MCO6551889.1 MMPL family transporter [Gilliamella sp.]MCO6559946.1 MMPL family transporter [Gilliamella sp.]
MNNCYSNKITKLKHKAILWGITVICLLVVACHLISNSKFNSSVLSLLPKEQTNHVPIEIINGFQDRLDKQLVWLIKPANSNNLEPVNWWYQQLQKDPNFNQVNGHFDEQFQQNWGQFAYKYRYQLIDVNTIERLETHKQFAWVQSQIYSPFSGVSATELNKDPLLLTRASQLSRLSNTGNLTIQNNWLTGKDKQGNVWYMIYAQLNGSSFDLNQSHKIVTELETLTEQLKTNYPGTEILKRGVLFYSDNASIEAKKDISRIGSLSIIGIIVLIIAVFRSITPILLSLLSILIGIICGLVAVLMVFGEIHVMTLVMSTSVIGITIDYSLHYLTERLLNGNNESPYASLKKLISTLTIALCTSFIAYLVLLIAPFPGLKQLSIFAVFGLIGAFLTVTCWYPFLVKNLPVRQNIGHRFSTFWLKLWENKKMQWITLSIAIVFIGYGFNNLKVDDDISKLQVLPADLQKEEQDIINITHQSSDQKWFIVFGDTAEQTLQRLESFLPKLEQAKQHGIFQQYQTINLPSIKKQQYNIALINKLAPEVVSSLQQIGVNVKIPNIEDSNDFITPEMWLKSEISQGQNLLWLSLPNGKSATLIPIGNVNQLSDISALSQVDNGIHWLDRHTEFNTMFTNYRIHLSQLIASAVIIICICFIFYNRKYGVIIALKSTLPTLLSIGVALSVHGIIRQPLNLFSMLALILVIGIGIDYSLFLGNHKSQTNSALLAVTMAALTTLLSFGLLIISNTNAIMGFGIVLTSGIFTAFIFAPLAIKQTNIT